MPDDPERMDADAAPSSNDGGHLREPATEEVSLWIDRDLLERFRSGGPDWQVRINATLRKAVGLDLG